MSGAAQSAGWIQIVLAAAGAVLAILGLLLLRRGWWPRRRGTDQHCRACGYSVVANESGRCPECGRELSLRNVVLGQRHRRAGVAAAGALVCLLAGACFWGAASERVRNIDWYRYRPAGWVVGDAASADPVRSARAWQELERRRAEGGLSPSAGQDFLDLAVADAASDDVRRAARAWEALERWRRDKTLPDSAEQKLVEAALVEQAKPSGTLGPRHYTMIDYLAERWTDGKLSAPQARKFFEQAMVISLRVRPVVSLGRPVPYEVRFDPAAPQEGDWYNRRFGEGVWLDGVQVERGGVSGAGRGFGGFSLGSHIPVTSPGTHTLTVKWRYEVVHARYEKQSEQDVPCSSREVTLRREFEVVRRPPEEEVNLLDRPDLLGPLRSCITVSRLGSDRDWPRDQPFDFAVEVDNPPVGVAFNVYLREGGKEHPAGAITLAKGGATGFHRTCADLHGSHADRMDLILRSSPEAAADTVDLTEIWKGEIVLPDVKVRHPPEREGR